MVQRLSNKSEKKTPTDKFKHARTTKCACTNLLSHFLVGEHVCKERQCGKKITPETPSGRHDAHVAKKERLTGNEGIAKSCTHTLNHRHLSSPIASLSLLLQPILDGRQRECVTVNVSEARNHRSSHIQDKMQFTSLQPRGAREGLSRRVHSTPVPS